MITYVDPVRTGRAALNIVMRPTGVLLLDGAAPLELRGDVASAVAWAQSRFDVLVYVLRDTYGMSVPNAVYAAACLTAYCALVTADGANEYNWNAGGLVCVDGRCQRTPEGALAAYVEGLDVALVALCEDVSHAPGLLDRLASGDVAALADARGTPLRPTDVDALRASLSHVRTLLAAGNAETLASLPGGASPSTDSGGEWLGVLALLALLATSKSRG